MASDAPGRKLSPLRPEALRQRCLLLALVLSAPLYAGLLTGGSFQLFGADQFGLVFNTMLAHMLRGRWDVDPAAIGYEAFIRDGRAYAYFGPFPALLRLPLLLLPHRLLADWRDLPVQRVSCWLAIMLGIAAQGRMVGGSLDRAPRRMRMLLVPVLTALCALSGAPMLLSQKGALLYHEPILWAWALAMLFVHASLPLTRMAGALPVGRTCALAVLAGLCLLTRSSTGCGLVLASGFLLLANLWRRGDTCPVRQRLSRPAFWLPCCVLGVSALAAGLVNAGRWGSPFIFADLRLQTILLQYFPDRLARLQRHGLFDLHRLGIGLLYYVFPVWTARLDAAVPLQHSVTELFDAIEPPASSLLLTDPVWCLLAVAGVMALSRRGASNGARLLAAGLAVPPAMMLTAWYLAFRYRIEFEPVLVMLASIGLRRCAVRFRDHDDRRAAIGLLVVCVLQVLGAASAGYAYARAPFGLSRVDQSLSLHCLLHPGLCAPSPPSP